MAEADDLLVSIGLTEKKYLATVARLEAQTQKAAKGMENSFERSNRSFVRGAQRANTSANAFANGGLRQIGMQLSQVAQQGAATGNWLQALSIQAADVGLAFGGIGIAVGTAITFLGPMAAGLLDVDSAAEELDAKMKSLSEAMSRLDAASASARRSRSDMIGEYGALAEQAERLFEIQKRIAAIRAGEAFKAATRGVAQGLGAGEVFNLDPGQIRDTESALEALRAEMDGLADASRMTDAQMRAATDRIAEIRAEMRSIKSVTSNFDELADMLGITEQQAREVTARFAEIDKMEAGQRQAEAMEGLANYIFEVSGKLAEAQTEGQELYDRLVAAATAAFELAQVDMAGPINDATDAADGLVSKLAAAVALFNRVSQQSSKEYGGRGGDPRDFMNGGTQSGDSYRANVEYETIDEIIAEANKKRSSGRKKSTRRRTGLSEEAKAEKDALREVERYVDKTRTAVEAYRHELKELEKLKPFFEQTGQAEAYARAVAMVNEEFRKSQNEEFIKAIEGVSGAMAGVIVDGENLGEALRGVFQQIARDLIASGIRELLMSTFGFGSKKSGGFLGKVFGGLLSFDGGGFTGVGARSGGVDGKGGFPAILHPNETVLDHTKGQSSGGSVGITVEVDGQGNIVPLIRRVSGQVSVQVTGSAMQAQRQSFAGQIQATEARGTSK